MARKSTTKKGTDLTHPLDQPRVRFNWGYHDAASESKRGTPRKVVEHGEHNTAQVSGDFNRPYYEGYKMGLADFAAGRYRECSEAAWVEFSAR